MAIAKVSLGLSVILSILNPPDSVETVYDYKNYIEMLLNAESSRDDKPKNPVGRPPKAQHAGYTPSEWRAVKDWVEGEVHLNPYVNMAGRRATTVAQHQPDVRGDIRLDNDMLISAELSFDGDRAWSMFPPSVMEV